MELESTDSKQATKVESQEKPAKRGATAEDMAARQRDISVTEFFTKNRHLLGFDSPLKSLLTAVKEAVDNSLDACEEAGIPPDVLVELHELAENRYRMVVEDNGPGILPEQVGKVFGKLQLVSAGLMGFSHGSNDSQKTVGIITFALIVGVGAGAFDPAHAPSWAQWFKPTLNAKNGVDQVPFWIIVLCAVTMAAGTAAGGWRIIRTMGHKMVKLQPVHGFAAETAAAITITGASELGIPLSTTHVISTSILGVGASKRFDAVRWGLVGRIVWAWVLTIPITLTLGYLFYRACVLFGWAK